MAPLMVCLLMAAKRPDISTRKIVQRVPSAITHRCRKPKRAPAWLAVAIIPTSRNPPMLVMIPSVISSAFLELSRASTVRYASPVSYRAWWSVSRATPGRK